MEKIEKNNNSITGSLAIVLLAAGAALLCWSLWMLPTAPVYGFPWEFALSVVAFLLISAAGWNFNMLVNRRRNASYRYGNDGNGAIQIALIAIAAGVMLLGFNSGVLPIEWRRVFFSWQMLLMLIAMSEYARGHITGGTVLLVLGGFFIVRRLAPLYPGIAESGMGDNWWPVLLIVAGVVILGGMIFGPRRGCRCENGGWNGNWNGNWNSKDWGGRSSKASGVIDTEVIFGGIEQVYLDPVFRGGRISAFFGGVKLDLRRTELPVGETWLKVESVFGGVEIDAPEEWNIEVRGTSFFGGFTDKRLPALEPGNSDDRKLVIKTNCVFGGGEIK